MIIVNEIVHETQNFEPELFWAANWDYNGVLNILDVIKMVNFVLNH